MICSVEWNIQKNIQKNVFGNVQAYWRKEKFSTFQVTSKFADALIDGLKTLASPSLQKLPPSPFEKSKGDLRPTLGEKMYGSMSTAYRLILG